MTSPLGYDIKAPRDFNLLQPLAPTMAPPNITIKEVDQPTGTSHKMHFMAKLLHDTTIYCTEVNVAEATQLFCDFMSDGEHTHQV